MRNWARSHELELSVGQVIFGVLLYLGSLYGNTTLYIVSAVLYAILVILAVVNGSRTSSVFTVVFSFLIFRYLPIVKYGQPLFGDPWSELRTAQFSADAGHVVALQAYPNPLLAVYGEWPLVHVLAVMLSNILAISLWDVFSYLAPIIAFPSLLAVFLLAREFFGDYRKAVLAGLIFSTFSLTQFWQVQMGRQNLSITLFCVAFYIYLKARQLNKNNWLFLATIVFISLTLTHSLTAFSTVVIFLFAFVFERFYWKNKASFYFPLFVVSLNLTSWVFFNQEFIILGLFERAISLFTSFGGGRVEFIQRKFLIHFDVFDFVSILRVLYLAGGSLYVILRVLGKRARFGWLLAGLFLGNGIPLSLAFFYQAIDERFSVLLTVPAALLCSDLRPNRKLWLGLILVLIVLPSPFKLYETFNVAPTYMYVSSASLKSTYAEFPKFHSSSSIFLARWATAYGGNMSVLADEYSGEAFQFYYDPMNVYFLGAHDRSKVSYHPYWSFSSRILSKLTMVVMLCSI